MHFSYRGFEQLNGIRKFKFAGVVEKQPQNIFCFSVDLKLFVQVLMRASGEGAPKLETCLDYQLGPEDMLQFTAPRRALALAHHNKKPTRLNRPKPSQASQVFGSPSVAF
jgi:hypothetical protein